MIRIVTIEHSDLASSEFVILQNQGGLRVRLRGHVLLSETCLDHNSVSCHMFTDDVTINPGHFVILGTGQGPSRWVTLDDGRYAYQTFIGRATPIWGREQLPLHVLSVQHSYEERACKKVLTGAAAG
ncbi:MAG: hypothetical protein JNJ45_02960 [Chthonomonas sp.]|nr:hypothetical protein [Chthonomonas sp.]